MATAAERLQDALIRHQIDIERLKKGSSAKFVKLLRTADAGMVAELRKRLNRFGATGPVAARKVKSLDKLIQSVIEQRRATWIELRRQAQTEFKNTAQFEAAISGELLEDSVGLEEFTVAAVAAGLFLKASRDNVYLGRTTAQHLKGLELAERAVIERSIRQGVFDGLSHEEIVTSLRGSRGFGFTDGDINQTRTQLNSVIASGVLAAAALGREMQFDDTGVVTGLIWVSVLDGRTTAICRSRDGFGVPMTKDFPKDIPLLKPPGARPPAHFNCRSMMESTIKDVGIVKPHRTFVTDVRTPKKRRIDFRAEAKRREGAGWAGMTERQRRRKTRVVSNEWAAKNIGTAAPQTTYTQFLNRQTAKFQDSVLGPTRGKLFRQGGLSLQQFVDFTGKQLTLEELAVAHPGAFQKAGLT